MAASLLVHNSATLCIIIQTKSTKYGYLLRWRLAIVLELCGFENTVTEQIFGLDACLYTHMGYKLTPDINKVTDYASFTQRTFGQTQPRFRAS